MEKKKKKRRDVAFVGDAMYIAWLPLKVSSIIGALGGGNKQQG